MNLKALILLAAACAALTAEARTAADVFKEAPATVVPLLQTNTRLDMLDYFNSGLSTPSANTFGGRSRITAMTDRALTIELSRDASMQIALVANGRDTVIAVIETVLTPVADSSIRLFRAADWTELPSPAMPGMAQFADPARRKELKTAEMPEYLFVRAEFDPETTLFRFTDTTPAYYTDADRPEGLRLLRQNIEMRLSGTKFTEKK